MVTNVLQEQQHMFVIRCLVMESIKFH